MPYYNPKSLPVFAIQYTGDNADEIKAAFKVEIQAALDSDYIYVYRKGRMGNIKVKRTDYLLGHNGNISVMREDKFEKRYEQEWREKLCSDPECEFCASRPIKPGEVNK